VAAVRLKVLGGEGVKVLRHGLPAGRWPSASIRARATRAPPLSQVWNAQSAGARGAIVVNYEDKMTTMEAPDDDDEANVKFLT
jgi:hypothetical protein